MISGKGPGEEEADRNAGVDRIPGPARVTGGARRHRRHLHRGATTVSQPHEYRKVRLEPAVLERFHVEDSPARRFETLLQAGLLREVDEEPEGSPLRRLLRVQEALRALDTCETALADAEHTNPLHTGGAPTWVLVFMGLVILVLVVIWNALVAVALGALILGACAWAGLAWYRHFEGRRSRLRKRLRREREKCRKELVDAMRHVFSSSFVAWTGHHRVECLPVLQRLEEEERAQGVTCGTEAEKVHRRARLEAIRRRLARLDEHPEPPWTERGLEGTEGGETAARRGGQPPGKA